MIKKVHVKTGDTVVVINGKNRGKQGKVMQVSPKEGKVIVEGFNMITKHHLKCLLKKVSRTVVL